MTYYGSQVDSLNIQIENDKKELIRLQKVLEENKKKKK